MIKLQLDWSTLTGLIEKNEGLLIEISQSVKANFAKTYLKGVVDSKYFESLKNDTFDLVRAEMNSYFAEVKERYGKLSVVDLKPAIKAEIRRVMDAKYREMIDEIVEEHSAKQYPDERISKIIERQVSRDIHIEVERQVSERMKAVMAAASS